MASAGKRNRIVVFQRLVDDPSRGAGGHVKHDDGSNWQQYVRRWCKVQRSSGGERSEASQRAPLYSAKIETSYDDQTLAITELMRCRFDGNVWHITSVVDVNDAHRSILITAEYRG
ncbi:MAG: phage head closure protein [Verrucomicrobiae bacterium]|nr:phage head closure protein [Verrucomicrobiae bacterium]